MWEHRLPSFAPSPGANLSLGSYLIVSNTSIIPRWRKVRAHVRLHEALRTQWNGGCFPARAARPETVQVGDVLVVVMVVVVQQWVRQSVGFSLHIPAKINARLFPASRA